MRWIVLGLGLGLGLVVGACSFDGVSIATDGDAASPNLDARAVPDASHDAGPPVFSLLDDLEISGPGVYDDPMMTANGDIYFAGPTNSGNDTQDIYMASWNPIAQSFEAATKLTGGINSSLEESTLWISPDGLTLLVARRLGSTPTNFDIFSATRTSTSENFSNASLLPSDPMTLLHSQRVDALGALSADRMSLFFVSNRNDQYNLYEATRPTPDAPFDDYNILAISDPSIEESSIKLSGDELTLFYGVQENEQDKNIYFATRANKNVPFSNPRPLDSINTTVFDDDYSPHPSAPSAVFSSNRDGNNVRLYRVEAAP